MNAEALDVEDNTCFVFARIHYIDIKLVDMAGRQLGKNRGMLSIFPEF